MPSWSMDFKIALYILLHVHASWFCLKRALNYTEIEGFLKALPAPGKKSD